MLVQKLLGLMSNIKYVRMTVFGLWLSAYCVCLLLFFVAPLYRGYIKIPSEDVFDGITKISCVYIPILIAFAIYWFRPIHSSSNKKKKNSEFEFEKGFAALIITVFCNFFILTCTFVVLYVYPLKESGDMLSEDWAFEQAVNTGIIYIANPLSILAAAPLACLLGVESFTKN